MLAWVQDLRARREVADRRKMSVVFVRKPLPGINEKGEDFMNLASCEIFKNYQNLSPVLLSEVIQERDAYLCKSCESQLKTAVDLEEKLSKFHESSS